MSKTILRYWMKDWQESGTELRKGCLEILGTTFDASSKDYLRLMIERKKIAAFHFHKSKPYIDIYRGQKYPDGSLSKGFLKIDDPRWITTERWWEYSDKLRAGIRGYAYKIPWNKETDVAYVVGLIRQKFDQIIILKPQDPGLPTKVPAKDPPDSRAEELPQHGKGKENLHEQHYTSMLDESLMPKWAELRKRCLEMPGTMFDIRSVRYLSLMFQKKVIAGFYFSKSKPYIRIHRGLRGPDGFGDKGFL